MISFKDYYFQEKDFENKLLLSEDYGTFDLLRPFLTEISLNKLKRDTEKFQRVMSAKVDRIDFSGDKAKMSVKSLSIVPFKGVKTILFSAIVDGATDKEYKTVISVEGVEYFDEKKPGAIEVEFKKNKFFFKKLSSKQDIKSRCSCPDFRFRAAEADRKVKGLVTIPKFPRYTPTGTGKPVNPQAIPLICKHITLLYSELKDKGFIR